MALATGIDAGTSGVRIAQGRVRRDAFVLTRYLSRPCDGARPADVLADLLKETKLRAPRARLGVTGRDTMLRYSQVPRLADAQLRSLMKFEIEELTTQAGGNLASDFNLLPIPPGVTGDDTVLVALARNDALESASAALKETRASVGAFTPNAVALYDAFLKLGAVADDGVLLANVGAENTDVAILLGPDLAFARNLSAGGNLFTQALRERFGVDDARAEDMKRSLANLAPSAKGKFGSPQEEKVSNALLGAAGQFASLLQSTVTLAKSQLKQPDLRVERVLLCGGGARLLGLPDHLAAATGWRAQLFDPLESIDLGALPTEERADLERDRFEAPVALGLALASAERGLYRLDVLPERLIRRRRLLERTSFLAAAGVLAAGYLVADAVVTANLRSESTAAASVAQREAKQKKGVHEQAVQLAGTEGTPGRNAALADAATEYEGRAAVGASLLAVDRALRQHLPSDLWITKIRVALDRDAQHPNVQAVDLARPIVTIEGRGREGAEKVEQVFQTLTTKLVEQFPSMGFWQAPRRAKGFEFTLWINLAPAAKPAPKEPN